MRNISATSLAKLQQALGGEPIVFVTVQWIDGGQVFYYADKSVPGTPLDGRILQLGDIENVIKVSDSAKSQSVSILLNDKDGSLKNIINNNDIHKRIVRVWQWFTDINFGDAFVIFEGEISSPILWKEGDRSLSFEIVEKIEDREVGFSPEEGIFDFIPEDQVGKPWPLGFGTNIRVKVVKINEPPTGLTRNPVAFADPGLQQQITKNGVSSSAIAAAVWIDSMAAGQAAFSAMEYENLAADYTEAASIAASSLDAAKAYVADSYYRTTTTITNYRINPPSPPPTDAPSGDAFFVDTTGDMQVISQQTVDGVGQLAYDQAGQFFSDIAASESDVNAYISALQSAASQAQSQASTMRGIQKSFEDKAAQEAAKVSEINGNTSELEKQLEIQKAVGQITSVIDGQKFPRGLITVQIGEATLEGSFAGDTFYPSSNPANLINPIDPRDPLRAVTSTDQIEKGKFYVINPGATVKLVSAFPIYYIVNILPSVIHEVLGKRSVDGGAQVFTPIPASYYTVNIVPFPTVDGTGVVYYATMITLNRALSTYGEGWIDDIYVSFTSSVGPNTIDEIIWLIQTYTTHTFDPTSFNYVKSLIAQYPSNFVIIERKNIITMLEEMAFQARLAIWLASGVFYVKYLPLEEDAVDQINEDDVLFGSMELDHTRTEDIVTKMVASYKFNYEDKNPSQIILRYNINKYNVIKQDYNFYIYNGPSIVYLAATFWLIRKANTWKLLRIKCPLTKLRLEPFDTVLVNFDPTRRYVSNNPVKGVVQTSKYNSADNSVDVEVWLPIRLGEMDPYPFYWPSSASAFFYFPTNEEITDGRVGNPPNSLMTGPGRSAGYTITVDNTPHDLPGRALSMSSNRPRDWGAANVSDDRVGEVMQIPEYQGGTVRLPNLNPGVVDMTENATTNDGKSSFSVGDIIDIGTNLARTVTLVKTVVDGFRLLTQIFVTPPLDTSVSEGEPVLMKLSRGTIGDPISDAQDYVFKDFGLPPDLPSTAALTPPTPAAAGGGGDNVFPGRVVSGTGDTYQVEIFPKGVGEASHTITAKQLSIDPGEAIPAGEWTIVILVNGNYYMQFPVWI